MRLLYLLLFTLVISCKTNQEPKITSEIKPVFGVIEKNAMVVSARKEASKIGKDILQKGGNAFDAMVATEMALAVSYPYAGNLGGGGFMVYRKNNGETGAIDYREKAPLAASKDMYLDENGDPIPEKSQLGPLAVGVPGTIAGIFEVHKKFGTLSIKELLTPVVELAKKGYVITENQEKRLEHFRELFIETNKDTILYAKTIKANDTLKNPMLAKTLERIIENGKDEFYQGVTGEKLVAYIKSQGGIMTMEDLNKYEAKWRDPVQFSYKDLNIISMSPPSSGGVCLAQIMKMIEPYNLSEYGHNTLKSIQIITEAERRAYADRSFYLGDPDFVKIPIDTLISNEYLSERMKDFDMDKATLSSDLSYGSIPGYESSETTHYSIIDQFGNAISVTTTLNGAYGSKLYVPELGFFLNNEMDDFSAKPGTPNMFGLLGAEANAIEPEKRMLSSMTPTLVEKDGELWMSVGTPGGSTIITSVLQTILNVKEYGMTMQDAVNAPRFHHQWLPDVVIFEPNSFDKKILDSLKTKGYKTNEEESRVIGKVDGILVLPDGNLEGGADKRGDDAAVGF
ncbi:gamma-glutamyltranspeptidase / glutathione hydrolase [Aquimarina amphilecti]|uniref:Glutathione hydrolase proenzyme n=1 Tax=Aquimarina amphilecti TaxID=1038014 RepID=A0A1H7WWN1_AQUAM|nr:gamma-glutamyltransferase [Aquimarina amphilecti]SEM26010.1 gamma-glutamyltranspeptidase / glutathione hydrolase [Aquimarina amphilecti]